MPRGTVRPRLVCRHCGNNVGLWFHGWKHQTAGWRAKVKSCGRKLTTDDVVEVYPVEIIVTKPEPK